MMTEMHRASSQRLFGWLRIFCRGGGTGRRTGLKILRALAHGGSIPSLDIPLINEGETAYGFPTRLILRRRKDSYC